MRSIIPLFAVAFAASAPAVATELVPVRRFRSIELRGGGEVTLVPGPGAARDARSTAAPSSRASRSTAGESFGSTPVTSAARTIITCRSGSRARRFRRRDPGRRHDRRRARLCAAGPALGRGPWRRDNRHARRRGRRCVGCRQRRRQHRVRPRATAVGRGPRRRRGPLFGQSAGLDGGRAAAATCAAN